MAVCFLLPLALTLVVADKGDHGVNIAMETFQYGDNFFTFYTQRANWDEAYTICKATHSRLAVVHTAGRAEFLARCLSETQMGFEDVWVGGRFMKDVWVWAPTGRELPKLKSNKNYPPWVQLPTQRGKNCMAMDRKQHDEPLFVELHCRLPRPFVCEKSVLQAIDNYPQLGFKAGLGPHSYIMYHARVTWDEALAFCRQTGAMLAVVPDLHAADFLVSLMRRSRPEFESVWVGGQYLFGEWLWLSNNVVFPNVAGPDGYPPWINHTSRSGVGKDCLMLDHHACRNSKKPHRVHDICQEPVFIDTECSRKKDFICETKPDVREPLEVNSTYLGMRYFFSATAMSWYDAEEVCKERNMTLAALNTPQKLKFVISMMGELTDEWDHAWLGGVYHSQQHTWVWTTNNRTIPFPLSHGAASNGQNTSQADRFPPWCENSMVYENGSDCLNLDRGDHAMPIMYGMPCDVSQGFVCEAEDDSDPIVQDLELPSNYRLQRGLLGFNQAEQYCRGNETFLAVVNTMYEAKKLVNEIPPGASVWVGGRRENGHWRWKRTGEFIPDVSGMDGYPPWEKLTTDSGAQCLSMRTGPQDWPLFIERPCKDALMSLCQLPLKTYPPPDLMVQFNEQDYYFYFINVTWFNALEICAMAGALLTPVHNIYVAKFLSTATADSFHPLWVSGRYPSKAWEWVMSGEPISHVQGQEYPPWNTGSLDPDEMGQRGRGCLLLDRQPWPPHAPVFEGKSCSAEHMFVCVRDRVMDDQKPLYEKEVRLNNTIYTLIGKVTTFRRAQELCAKKGSNLTTVANRDGVLQLFGSAEGFKEFWINAELSESGTWELRNNKKALETDIEFADQTTDPDSENKCLFVRNTSSILQPDGNVQPNGTMIALLSATCNDHARVVCEKPIVAGPEEKKVETKTVRLVARRGKTWDEAAAACRNLGMFLAAGSAVTWAETLRFVTDLYPDFGDIWIGGRTRGTSDWMWENTESRINFTVLPPWKTGAPKQGDNCLLIVVKEKTPKLSATSCNSPLSYVCQEELKKCPLLDMNSGLVWTPERCALDLMEKGSVCKAACGEALELQGPERVVCTEGNWISHKNLTQLPRCISHHQTLLDMRETLEETFKQVGVLFVLDESRSYGRTEYSMAKRFIQNIIGAYPLGNVRSAGVTVFSTEARHIIEVTEHNTCYFFEELSSLEQEGTKGRNFMNALISVEQELREKKYQKKGVVFFITNGVDEGPVNRTVVADRIKDMGILIYVIGVGKYIRNQLEELASVSPSNRLLMYSFDSFEALNAVALGFRRDYKKITPNDCH